MDEIVESFEDVNDYYIATIEVLNTKENKMQTMILGWSRGMTDDGWYAWVKCNKYSKVRPGNYSKFPTRGQLESAMIGLGTYGPGWIFTETSVPKIERFREIVRVGRPE